MYIVINYNEHFCMLFIVVIVCFSKNINTYYVPKGFKKRKNITELPMGYSISDILL